jgi:hypothetical protein
MSKKTWLVEYTHHGVPQEPTEIDSEDAPDKKRAEYDVVDKRLNPDMLRSASSRNEDEDPVEYLLRVGGYKINGIREKPAGQT